MSTVKITNLNFVYPDGTIALQNINLEVQKDETVAILGANGSGKTTLLLHLNGLLKGKGLIEICGLGLNRKILKEVRQKVGLVFQNPDDQLFSLTVFDDVAFAPMNLGLNKEEVEHRVKKALAEAGVIDCETSFPHHLSVGEKKRVAVATVLAQRPEILVLDEPSGNLDPKGRRQLINLLKDLPLTKIIASHDLDLVAEICERVVLLYQGQIVAEGKTSEILNDGQLLAKYDLIL